MANSIRTPRQGTSETSRRIAQAVDNEDWQRFRLLLKGTPTREKLNMLSEYWRIRYNSTCEYVREPHGDHGLDPDIVDCDVCIRVDNYIKALCRGGQLARGESLLSMIRCNWNPDIKS